jgi:hypothetical protein
MERFEDGDNTEAGDATGRIPDARPRRYWAERASAEPFDDDFSSGPILFAERGAEAELRREIRLSELWARCQGGFFSLHEFGELSTLITEVDGIKGSLCVDCAMLDRPNVSANWALANTTLCRGHLRFRLAHAQTDGGGTYRPT